MFYFFYDLSCFLIHLFTLKFFPNALFKSFPYPSCNICWGEETIIQVNTTEIQQLLLTIVKEFIYGIKKKHPTIIANEVQNEDYFMPGRRQNLAEFHWSQKQLGNIEPD